MLCAHCKEKPAEGDNAISHNYKHLCRGCFRLACAKNRKTEKGRAWISEYSKKRYLKFREKNLARAKVRYAVEKGAIIKPTLCTDCLLELPLHAHHEDYDKPLEVVWLCQICHKHRHGKIVDKTLLTQPRGKSKQL